MSKSYRKAADDVVAAIKSSRDKELQKIFWVYFNATDEHRPLTEEEKTKWKKSQERHQREGARIVPPTIVAQSAEGRLRNLSKPQHKHFTEGADNMCELLFKYPFGRKFLAQFGDVIRFPLDYKVTHPSDFILNMFWTFRPAYLGRPTTVRNRQKMAEKIDEKSNLSSLLPVPLFINTNFSDATICKFAADHLRDFLRNKKDALKAMAPHRNSAPKWKTLNDTIKIFEIEHDAKDQGKKISSAAIYDALGKKKGATSNEKTKFISNKKKRFPFMKVFERPEPHPDLWEPG